MTSSQLAAAVLTAVAIGAVWPLSRLGRVARGVSAAVILVVLMAVAPLAHAGEPYQTWLLGVCVGTCAFRAYDYLMCPPPRGAAGHRLAPALVYLLAWPSTDVSHFLDPWWGPRLGPAAARAVRAGVKVALGVGLLMLGYRLGLPATSAVLDQVLKLVEIYLFGSGASDLVVGFWMLLGFRHPDAFDHLFRSRSVLEFWSRYDRWIFVGLKRHVFDRVGRRRPVRAVMATFAVSGALHAVLFAEAVPGVAANQLEFFVLQGVAALVGEPLSRRLRRSGSGGILLARGLTIGFLGTSSVLFLRGVDALASLHGRTGAWLAHLLHVV